MQKVLAAVLLGCSGTPQPPETADPPVEPSAHNYRRIGGEALRAYVFFPAPQRSREPAPAILLFHGGGWQSGAPEWTFEAARRFADLGLIAISVQYRLSEGAVTPIEALEDVCAAFRWAREQAARLGLDPGRVAGYGVSAGGHLVASTATIGCPSTGAENIRAQPDLLLLWSPAVDVGRDPWFEKLLQGRGRAADYAPADHVGASTPPTSIVQGAEDTLTPLVGARRYCDRLTALGRPCELHVYEGLGHLLTRNLANQESDYDPNPEARADGIARHVRFLREMGFVKPSTVGSRTTWQAPVLPP